MTPLEPGSADTDGTTSAARINLAPRLCYLHHTRLMKAPRRHADRLQQGAPFCFIIRQPTRDFAGTDGAAGGSLIETFQQYSLDPLVDWFEPPSSAGVGAVADLFPVGGPFLAPTQVAAAHAADLGCIHGSPLQPSFSVSISPAAASARSCSSRPATFSPLR